MSREQKILARQQSILCLTSTVGSAQHPWPRATLHTSSGWKACFQTGRRACQDIEPNTKGPSKERNLPQVSIFESLDNRLPFDRIVNSSISESEVSQTCFGLRSTMPLGQGSISQCYIFLRLIRTTKRAPVPQSLETGLRAKNHASESRVSGLPISLRLPDAKIKAHDLIYAKKRLRCPSWLEITRKLIRAKSESGFSHY